MKKYLSFWVIPLLIMLSGCSTRVSTHHRHHGHEYRHHNHVSVGVHGRSSGAGVLGVLIVGGIIGSIIHDQQHQHDDDTEHQHNREDQLGSSDAEELTNGYSIETKQPIETSQQLATKTDPTRNTDPTSETIQDEFQQAKQNQSKKVEWYQVGKDGKCYLMGVSNGVTDVIAAVPDTNCRQ